MRRAAVVTVVALALAPGGCQRAKEPPPSARRAAAPRQEASGNPATRTTVKQPRIKATATVDDKKLGTLPEGVGLPVGSRVADVAVKTHLGQTVHLAELVKTGPLMLIFYRGGW